MEQSGRLMIVLEALLVSAVITWTSSAQSPDPQPATPRPSPSTADDVAIDLRRPINFAAVFRSPGESTAPAVAASGSTSSALESGHVAEQPAPLPAPTAPGAPYHRARPFGQPSPSPTPTPVEAADLAPPLAGLSIKLKAAPLEPTDLGFPINLATALRLSDARPLIVAAAQASVWVAEAQLTRAKVLWVPQLNLGGDYIRHDGGGPDFNKGILTAPSVNFFYGGGGLWEIQSLTDVFFEPWSSGRCSIPAKPTFRPPRTTPR